VTIIVAVSALAVTASGQVTQLNTGQQLDANSQIGSGGYNTLRPGQGGVNSQLIVSGQTSGLTPFRGHVGYFAPNQLELNLPSAQFDAYRGQSVGLGDIIRRQRTYQTNPYYSQGQTAYGVSGIVQGRTAPGTNAPINSIGAPVAPYVYAEDIKAYAPIVSDVGVPTLAAPPPVITADSPIIGKYIGSDAAAYAPNAPIFSGLTEPQRQQLARELYDLAQREEPNSSQIDANVNTRVNAQAGTPTPIPPLPSASPQLTPGARPPTPADQPRPAKSTPAVTEPGATVTPNQDIFSDVLLKLYQQRTQKAPSEQTPPVNLTNATPAPRPTANNALVELRGNEVVLHSLAGVSKDSFNLFMASAQAKMKGGKFYAASRDYESALIVNPSNPLALEGQGMAKFAAGEPYSAAFSLSRAIQLFPPLIETRLDINALVDEKTFQERLATLDQRLAAGTDRQDPLLLMLAAFLHHNAAQTQKANTYAQLLKDSPKTTKLMQAYATYVLTGKRPVQPATKK
jgi:tetratricopeptide (TPR) repeat protein